jgi:hypothetical protein
MWDLNTIVRLNDEAQRRADAIREQEARLCQPDEQKRVVSAVPNTTDGKSCEAKQAAPSR